MSPQRYGAALGAWQEALGRLPGECNVRERERSKSWPEDRSEAYTKTQAAWTKVPVHVCGYVYAKMLSSWK
jgi:hypothetical protein